VKRDVSVYPEPASLFRTTSQVSPPIDNGYLIHQARVVVGFATSVPRLKMLLGLMMLLGRIRGPFPTEAV
jgi:hypothetical protein